MIKDNPMGNYDFTPNAPHVPDAPSELERYRDADRKKTAEINILTQENRKVYAELERVRAELAHSLSHGYCVYCGHVGLREEIAEHIFECVKHPMGELARKWEAEKDELRAELAEARAALAQHVFSWETTTFRDDIRSQIIKDGLNAISQRDEARAELARLRERGERLAGALGLFGFAIAPDWVDGKMYLTCRDCVGRNAYGDRDYRNVKHSENCRVAAALGGEERPMDDKVTLFICDECNVISNDAIRTDCIQCGEPMTFVEFVRSDAPPLPVAYKGERMTHGEWLLKWSSEHPDVANPTLGECWDAAQENAPLPVAVTALVTAAQKLVDSGAMGTGELSTALDALRRGAEG